MNKLEVLLKSLFAIDGNGKVVFRVFNKGIAGALTNATSTKSNRSLTTMFNTAISKDRSGNPALNIVIVDEVLLLGTIAYTAINAGAAATSITLTLATNQIPIGKMVAALALEFVTALASPSNPHVGLVIAQSEHFPVTMFEGDMNLRDFTTGVKIMFPNVGSTKVTTLTSQPITLKFDVGGGEVNPKNFTAGSIKVYAILKDSPI